MGKIFDDFTYNYLINEKKDFINIFNSKYKKVLLNLYENDKEDDRNKISTFLLKAALEKKDTDYINLAESIGITDNDLYLKCALLILQNDLHNYSVDTLKIKNNYDEETLSNMDNSRGILIIKKLAEQDYTDAIYELAKYYYKTGHKYSLYMELLKYARKNGSFLASKVIEDNYLNNSEYKKYLLSLVNCTDSKISEDAKVKLIDYINRYENVLLNIREYMNHI